MSMTTTRPNAGDTRRRDRMLRLRRAGALTVVLALAGFWAWAFSPFAPRTKADGLTDRSYVQAANQRCKDAKQELNRVPLARTARTPTERADILDRANVVVAGMAAGLRTDASGAVGRDRELLDQWLGDWDAYVASRMRYAAALRTDPDARFLVPGRSGGQITQTMDGFSRVNRITECIVPLDV
jgi:hypothetical protein